jgi:hypothetical protein
MEGRKFVFHPGWPPDNDCVFEARASIFEVAAAAITSSR